MQELLLCTLFFYFIFLQSNKRLSILPVATVRYAQDEGFVLVGNERFRCLIGLRLYSPCSAWTKRLECVCIERGYCGLWTVDNHPFSDLICWFDCFDWVDWVDDYQIVGDVEYSPRYFALHPLASPCLFSLLLNCNLRRRYRMSKLMSCRLHCSMIGIASKSMY